MKYRELPECKSADEFKVGEQVRVYNSSGDSIIEVVTISPPFLNNEICTFHFKQCRKVVAVKPREFKYCYRHDQVRPGDASAPQCPIDYSWGDCEWIKVREVLDES